MNDNRGYQFSDHYKKLLPEEKQLYDSYAGMTQPQLALASIGCQELHKAWISHFIQEIECVGPHPQFYNTRSQMERLTLKISASLWKFYALSQFVEIASLLQSLLEFCVDKGFDFLSLCDEGKFRELLETPDEPDETMMTAFTEELKNLIQDWVPQLHEKEVAANDVDSLTQIVEVEKMFHEKSVNFSLSQIQLNYLARFLKQHEEARELLWAFQKEVPLADCKLPENMQAAFFERKK